MNVRLLIYATALAFEFRSAALAQNAVAWEEVVPNFWIAQHQNWINDGREVKFTAIKFHLGYYKMALIGVADFAKRQSRKLIALNDPNQFSESLIDVGIRNIFKARSSQFDVVAVFPAGWSTTLKKPEQAGLLRVNSALLSPLDNVHHALSAILCLESPAYKAGVYDYQIPVFYDLSRDDERRKSLTCTDAVQVGPRILDVPTEPDGGRGIHEAELERPPQLRVVFALDEPNRRFTPNTDRKNARNGYVIVTENPVHLWDLQAMLIDSRFYGDGSHPYRAINMSGGGASGMAIRDPHGTGKDREPLMIGNPSGIIGSAIEIVVAK